MSEMNVRLNGRGKNYTQNKNNNFNYFLSHCKWTLGHLGTFVSNISTVAQHR